MEKMRSASAQRDGTAQTRIHSANELGMDICHSKVDRGFAWDVSFSFSTLAWCDGC